jgi:DUF917 family protein
MTTQVAQESVLRTSTDVEDFVNGTNLLSGSGGSPVEVLEHLYETLAEGRRIEWQPIEDLDDDALVVSVFYHGATDPESWRDRTGREHANNVSRVHRRPLEQALARLEHRLGREADAIIPIEIGASNTGAALDLGSRLGRTVLDGDYAGRAIPSFDCILPALNGWVKSPMALADYYGNVIEIVETANVRFLESFGKMSAIASLGRIGAAGLALSGAQVKQVAARTTLTESLSAGRMLRSAREAGGDVVAQVVQGIPGCQMIFEGRLTYTERMTDVGYMTGQHVFEGTATSAGSDLRIYFKNENHVAWFDESVAITSPDVIEIVDRASAEPLVNTYLQPGQEVAVLGIPCRPEWQTPAGVAALGPSRWGFDLPYQGLAHRVSDKAV